MPIEPDVKDWTWVLERPCPECGFDATAVSYADIPDRARECAARLRDALGRADVAVRPDEHTWSALEYAAHVRDVCRVFAYRVAVAAAAPAMDPGVAAFDPAVTTVDGLPQFANWDQDAAALAGNYRDLDPAVLGAELAVAADAVAEVIAAVPAGDRDRRVRRGGGSTFTVETLAQYFLHDLVHHVHDVGC
ncbi:DinB family protein [Nocardia cyriacigeorgica]|uniref:DinB family protein n=1 Tax=Nocardia cyriacigeorgica TaxID=135487 RepID=A0A6P1CM59_9NOCA|nr:DinB family protein [Nocardia cyriacigeorgica]NEW32434.1 DinB family protein [Nocardia cyriacigeorgica]BDT86031.1 methyltransferase type 12 [Nocardia cyriacigeorgica]